MKRDMDLIRAILLNVEEKRKGNKFLQIDYEDFAGHKPEDVYGHLVLISDSGLLKPHHQSFDMLPMTNGLTKEGFDFLDSVRNPEIWEKTKKTAEKVGGWTIDILADLAKGFLKTKIAKHTGVEI